MVDDIRTTTTQMVNPFKIKGPFEGQCIPKAIMAYCFGGGMGFVMAAFMSAMEMRDIDLGKSRRSTRHVLKKDLRRIIGTSKGFAIFGGIILFYQCMIEHVRMRDDGANTFMAGAATSMVLAANLVSKKDLMFSGVGGGFMCYIFYKAFKWMGY